MYVDLWEALQQQSYLKARSWFWELTWSLLIEYQIFRFDIIIFAPGNEELQKLVCGESWKKKEIDLRICANISEDSNGSSTMLL